MRSSYRAFARTLASFTLGALAAVSPGSARGQVSGGVAEQTGVAQYSVPIVVPPGTAGASPDLALVYSSGGGKGPAGWVGFGWQLAGESRIQRNTKRGVPYDYENYQTQAPPQMCGNGPCYLDDFEVDGADLVCEDLACTSGIYKTRSDDGRRIEYLSASTGWTIHTRDGTKYVYGASASHRVVNPTNSQVYSWLLKRVEDVSGNWITYTYDTGDPSSPGIAYLAKIEYAQQGAAANRWIDFIREGRTDPALSYRGGLREEMTERLARIEVRADPGTLVTAYELNYSQGATSGRSLLGTVQRFGSDDPNSSLPPHTFEYSARSSDPDAALYGFEYDETKFSQTTIAFGGTAIPNPAIGYFQGLIDINGDALVDYFGEPGTVGHTPGWTEARLSNGLAFAATPVDWGDDPSTAVPFTSASQYITGPTYYTTATTVDINGDSHPDALTSSSVRLGSATGYGAAQPWTGAGHPGEALDNEVIVQLIDLTGDGRPDYVDCNGGEWRMQWNRLDDPNSAVGGFSADWISWPDPQSTACRSEVGANEDTHFDTIDINGDGLPDRVWNGRINENGIWVEGDGIFVAYNTGSGFVEHDPNQPSLDAPYRLDIRDIANSNATRGELVDINGDGFPDYVGTWKAGWLEEHFGPSVTPPWVLTKPRWGVFFGDGTGFADQPVLFRACDEGPPGSPAVDCDVTVWEYASIFYQNVSGVWGFADFNGDSLVDRFRQNTNLIHLNVGPIADLLTSAKTPLGGAVRFDYSTSGEMKVESADPNRPLPANPQMPFSRPVVERMTVLDDPNTSTAIVTDYHYAGGVFDSTLKTFHGFATIERTEISPGDPNGPAGTAVVSTYAVDAACSGSRQAIAVAYGADALRRETRTHVTIDAPVGAVDPIETWHACLLESVTGWAEEELGAPGGTARARRTLYDYGSDPVATYYNVQAISDLGEVDATDPNIDISGDARTTKFLYTSANATENLVSRVSERWVEDPVAPSMQHAHTRFYYDGQALGAGPVDGQLTKVERWSENAYSDPNATPGWVPVRELVYGTYGILTQVIEAPHEVSGGSTARVQTILNYDPTGTFLTLQTETSDDPNTPPLVTSFSYSGCPVGSEPPAGLGLVCTVTAPGPLVTTRGYDKLGRVTEIHAPSGLVEARAYQLPSPSGPAETVLTTTLDDPNGAVLVSTVTLDGLGRPIEIDQPGKSGETIRVERSYDERGRLATETLPRRVEAGDPILTRAYTYDRLGRPASMLDVDGQTLRTWTYGPWEVTSEAFFDPQGLSNRQERTERVFDAYGRLETVTNYADVAGLSNPLTVTAHYDVLHQLVQVDDPVESGATCTGCQAGQIHTTLLAYDTLGRRVWIDDPDSGEWLFRYDSAGLLKQRTDARGKIVQIEHDALGRVAARKFPGMPNLDGTFTYDADGRLVEIAQATIGFSYTYDTAGRVATATQITNGLLFANEYFYDAFGRVTQRTFPDGEIFGHVYDGTRLVAIEKENAGGFDMFLSADYDGLGRMTGLEVARTDTNDPTSPAATLERTFDANTARLTGMKVIGRGNEIAPNLDLTLGFDGLGRLETMDGSYGATALVARSFSYDGLGRLDTATGPWEKPQSNPNAVTWTYQYDVLGNLRGQTSTGTYTRDWQYADASRPRFLTEFSEVVGADPNQTVTDVMVPDAAGNTASINGETLSWNHQNRMTFRGDPMSQGINYFDPFGNRVMRWFGGTQLIYVGADFEYDTALGLSTKYFFLNGERVASRSIYYTAQSAWIPPLAWRWIVVPFSPAVAPVLLGLLGFGFLALLLVGFGVRVPVWVSGPGVALLAGALVLYPFSVARAVIGGGGGPEWHGGHSRGVLIYGNDHLGSTRVVIDAYGDTVETRDYAPFGKEISQTGPFDLKHRFTSQTWDDAGVDLYNYNARMYEPRWGRFVSPDELVQSFDSQGVNPFAYVGNQPTSRTDPTGNQMFDPGDTWNMGNGPKAGGRWSPTHQSDLAYAKANPAPTPKTGTGRPSAFSGGAGGLAGAHEDPAPYPPDAPYPEDAVPVPAPGPEALLGAAAMAIAIPEPLTTVGGLLAIAIIAWEIIFGPQVVPPMVLQKNEDDPRSNPFRGPPGSTSKTETEDGETKQTRRYGPDGYPEVDLDYDDHHGQGKPHVHDWGRPPGGGPPTAEDRGPGRAPRPGDPDF